MVDQPRRWGYHRLVDPWPRRLVRAAGVRPGELVLDIGAGDGALTAALVSAGVRVIAVELHPRRVAGLRTRFAADPVRVVRADAADLLLPRRPFRVLANPPYSVTAALLHRLFRSRMYAADLVLPASYVAQHVRRGHRSFELRRGLYVPRGAFRPPPPRDSAVLVVRSGRLGDPRRREHR